MAGCEKFGAPGPGGTAGSHTTLVKMPFASSPKSGLANRTALLPEPAKNSTFPLGSRAACTARTPDLNGNTSHRPSRAGSGSRSNTSYRPAFCWGGLSMFSTIIFRTATEIGHCKATALVFPREPTRHTHPWFPVVNVSGDLQPRGTLEERLVLLNGIVNLKDDEIVVTGLLSIDHRDAGTLVFPRKPVRHQLPICPAGGDQTVGIEPFPNAVVSLVLLLCVVDHEDDQFRAAIAVKIADRNGAMLVLPREPIWNAYPVGPSAGHIAVVVQ